MILPTFFMNFVKMGKTGYYQRGVGPITQKVLVIEKNVLGKSCSELRCLSNGTIPIQIRQSCFFLLRARAVVFDVKNNKGHIIIYRTGGVTFSRKKLRKIYAPSKTTDRKIVTPARVREEKS